MSEQLTLMDFIRELLGLEGQDKAIQLRDYFEQNPHAALQEYGLGHLSPEDVHDAIVLFQDNDTVSFDRDYDTGSNWLGSTWGTHAGAIDWGKVGVHTAGPEQWREHVTNNHVTNNVDDRDTIIDQSVNQQVETHGGDFSQSVDNHSVNATGDGAVAAGDDIEGSTITTGDGNVVGDGNQVVSGDGNTTAFGSGSAVKDVSVEHGSGFSVNGDASGDSSTNDSHNRTWTEDNDHTSTSGSYNQETDNSVETHVDDHSHTDVGSHNDVDLHFG
jgi:hypothetical protein